MAYSENSEFQEFGDVSGSRIRVRESFQKRGWSLPRDRFVRGFTRGPGIARFARARMNGFNAAAFRNQLDTFIPVLSPKMDRS